MFLPAQPEQRGPCTLELSGEDGPLDAPYVIGLRSVDGGPAEASVNLMGSGWDGIVQISGSSPSRPLLDITAEAQSINEGRISQVMNEAGTWAFTYEDPNCRWRFTVEVQPLNG